LATDSNSLCRAVFKMPLRKDQLEASLHEEKKLIEDGKLKEDSPLDVSESFRMLSEACRRGDLKVCQELITDGVNINARDPFDYTPLILVGSFSAPALISPFPTQFCGSPESLRFNSMMTDLQG
jgi:hypothetical protein